MLPAGHPPLPVARPTFMMRFMSPRPALFRSLFDAADWAQLAPAVQRMHGDGNVLRASGRAIVEGDTHTTARWARHLLGLPQPGNDQSLALTIERHEGGETWTRIFARGRMRSTLGSHQGTQLRERLGPVSLHFALRREADAATGGVATPVGFRA